MYYLTQSEIEYTTKVTWIENPLGIMALVTAKISVAFLILRLIGPSTVWRKWSLYVSIVLNFVIAVLACILTFVQCNPPRALWEAPSQVPGAKCWNPKHQADYAIFTSGKVKDTDWWITLLKCHSLFLIYRLLPCRNPRYVHLESKLGYSPKDCFECVVEFGCFVGDSAAL